MIITRAPLRISFLGGGSDFISHFSEHGGAVLGSAINKYVYVTVANFDSRFHGCKFKLSYSRTEEVSNVDDIKHPAIREAIRFCDSERGLELHHISDIPACTGLGSSSSFVVALLQALYGFCNRWLPMDQLAHEAIKIERNILRETGGYQDQVFAAYGGIDLIEFADGGQFAVQRLPLSPQRVADIETHSLVLYTGIRRNSFEVLEKQSQKNCSGSNTHVLKGLADLARSGASYLTSAKPLEGFGELLHEGWGMKKQLSDVSLPIVDDVYGKARELGATGGKILGAGKGGFLLLWAAPHLHSKILESVPKEMLPMDVHFNTSGSSIVHSL